MAVTVFLPGNRTDAAVVSGLRSAGLALAVVVGCLFVVLLLVAAVPATEAPSGAVVDRHAAVGHGLHDDVPINESGWATDDETPRRGGQRQVRADGATVSRMVGGTREFDIDEWSNSLQVGERGRFVATFTNRGNTTVRNAVLVYTGEGLLQPITRESSIGTLRPGRSDQVEFTFDVPADVDPGEHALPFVLQYQTPDGEARTSPPLWIETVIDGQQSFALENVSSTLRVGDTGTISADLVNTGDRTTEGIVVAIEEPGPTLVPLDGTASVGPLSPGDSERVSFRFEVTGDAEAGPQLLNFRVRYRGQEDRIRTSEAIDAAVTVDAEQTFAIDNVSSSLRVDDTGTVRATVVNTGGRRAEGVVVVLDETGPTLVPRESTAAVESLAPGERAPVQFRVDVTADAEPGSRLLNFRVRYRGQEGDVRTSESIDAPVRVEPRQDEFALTAVNATIPAGDTKLVTVRVANRENQTLRDVRARLFVDDPLTSDSSEAFVPALEPNETTTLTFEVSAGAGALARQYPLLVDFTYEDASGESVLSDTYFVPLTVTEPAPREFPVPVTAVAAGVALLLVVGLAYWQRGTIAGFFRR